MFLSLVVKLWNGLPIALRAKCVSITGVKLWNGLPIALRAKFVSIAGFKLWNGLRIALRAKCVSIAGFKLWNGLRIALRNCRNIFALKKFTKHLYLIDTKQIFYYET